MTAIETVDQYIAAQPRQTQARLRELRQSITAAVPQAVESIRYGMPTYKVRRASVHFGAAKGHCALYGAAIQQFAEELRGYETGRGTLRFPLDQPVPDELVRKLVAAKLLGH